MFACFLNNGNCKSVLMHVGRNESGERNGVSGVVPSTCDSGLLS